MKRPFFIRRFFLFTFKEFAEGPPDDVRCRQVQGHDNRLTELPPKQIFRINSPLIVEDKNEKGRVLLWSACTPTTAPDPFSFQNPSNVSIHSILFSFSTFFPVFFLFYNRPRSCNERLIHISLKVIELFMFF